MRPPMPTSKLAVSLRDRVADLAKKADKFFTSLPARVGLTRQIAKMQRHVSSTAQPANSGVRSYALDNKRMVATRLLSKEQEVKRTKEALPKPMTVQLAEDLAPEADDIIRGPVMFVVWIVMFCVFVAACVYLGKSDGFGKREGSRNPEPGPGPGAVAFIVFLFIAFFSPTISAPFGHVTASVIAGIGATATIVMSSVAIHKLKSPGGKFLGLTRN
jgi:hypothetical protein